jgi:hypothetical protein
MRAIVAVGFPWWMRPFLIRGVVAITIGRRIWIHENQLSAGPDELKSVLRHELIHVRQMGELGVTRFVWRYLREYVGNRLQGMNAGDAYRNISLEHEAFTASSSDRGTASR